MTRKTKTPLESLGANVVRYRTNIRLSQEELAARTGLSTATIYRLESGKENNPVFTTLCQISTALGIKLSHLMEGI